MNKMTLIPLITMLLLPGFCLAAPLNWAHLPAEAKWMVHVDLDAFSSSEMGELIRREINEEIQKKLDALRNFLGSDPTKDIYGVTIYGSDPNEENTVVMIYGQFNKDKLLTMLILNEDYSESEYKGKQLYHWLDEKENKQMVGMFATDNHIVFSQSEPAVQAAADLLAGEKDSQAMKGASLAALVEMQEDAFMVMAADGLAELEKNKDNSEILQNIEKMTVIVGEKNGSIYMQADLTSEINEAAMQIEQVLVGIKAFISLKHAEQPEAMSLLEAVILERSENQLFLSVQYPSAKLFEIIKNRWEIIIAKRILRMNKANK